MPVTKQSVTLVFQDAAGNPVAFGSVTLRLQVDISTATPSGPQVSAGRLVTATLDSSGSLTVDLWPNNTTTPASVYFVQCYTVHGQPVWKGELTVTQ